jgi:hypothetical protein
MNPAENVWQGFHIIACYFIKSHVSSLESHIKMKNRTLIKIYTIFDTRFHSENLTPSKKNTRSSLVGRGLVRFYILFS